MKNHSEKCAYAHNKYDVTGKMTAHCMCMSSHECDCDGYHTFDELYDHRITLYIALCKQITHQPYDNDEKFGVWRSKNHFNGEPAFGGSWFVLGIGKGKGSQITYHLPIEKWDVCDFAEELEKAPEWDGHTSDDVLERMKNL